MGASFEISSELLENFKKYSIVATEKKMQAMCSADFKCFMSIGDDDRLYLTYENDSQSSGWMKLDLCQALDPFFNGQSLQVKTFAAVQDAKTRRYLILVSIVADEKDYLYISTSAPNDILSQDWREVPISEDIRRQFTVGEVNLSSYNGILTTIVDMRRPNGQLERFFISTDPNAKDLWRFYPLPANFDQIGQTVAGRPEGERVDGLYTLGWNAGQCQLLFTPSRNIYDPEVMPPVTRFHLPAKVDAVAVCPAEDGQPHTHLFGCGSEKLFLFPSDAQPDLAEPIELMSSPFLRDVSQLFAFESRGRIYIWALNASKTLVYAYVDRQSLRNQTLWSPLLLMRDDLNYVFPFADQRADVNSLFGYLTTGRGILGEESAVTGLWAFHEVFLDSPGHKPLSMLSYTTRIVVRDETGNPLPGRKIALKASEPCLVYINGNAYYFRDNPIEIPADANGIVKIVQQAGSPTAIGFKVAEPNDPANALGQDIDPSEKVIDRALSLDTADKLRSAKIVSQSGAAAPLVSPEIDDESLKAVAEAMGALNSANIQIRATEKALTGLLAVDAPKIGVKLSFNHGRISSKPIPVTFKGLAELAASPVLNMTAGGKMSFTSYSYSPGDVFNFLRSLIDEVFEVVICFLDEAWNFIVRVGETIVSFVIDCVERVIACVVEIFNLIKVLVEDLLRFLQFIFDMDDIVKTKEVMEKIVNTGLDDLSRELSGLKVEAVGVINELIKVIEHFGELEDVGPMGKKTLEET